MVIEKATAWSITGEYPSTMTMINDDIRWCTIIRDLINRSASIWLTIITWRLNLPFGYTTPDSSLSLPLKGSVSLAPPPNQQPWPFWSLLKAIRKWWSYAHHRAAKRSGEPCPARHRCLLVGSKRAVHQSLWQWWLKSLRILGLEHIWLLNYIKQHRHTHTWVMVDMFFPHEFSVVHFKKSIIWTVKWVGFILMTGVSFFRMIIRMNDLDDWGCRDCQLGDRCQAVPPWHHDSQSLLMIKWSIHHDLMNSHDHYEPLWTMVEGG